MVKKEPLTTEHLKKDFPSSFELVNYSIKQAKDMIKSDRQCRVTTPIHNRAYQILLEIACHKDFFENIDLDDEEEKGE